jgi:hypothetical protein
MNFCLRPHIPDDFLERYAMARLSPLECASFEEHLLICPICQERLAGVEEFVVIIRAALVELGVEPVGRIGAQAAVSL